MKTCVFEFVGILCVHVCVFTCVYLYVYVCVCVCAKHCNFSIDIEETPNVQNNVHLSTSTIM